MRPCWLRGVCGSGSEVSRRDVLEHVDVESLVGDQLLQPGVFGLKFFEPFGLVGFHAAVLGQPAMPRRLCDLQMPAHLVEFLTRGEKLVALGELANDLIRRMPPTLVRCHVVVDSSCPNTGQQSPTTTGPLQRAHLKVTRRVGTQL